jgi:mono/diheme cytochrome c family protein
MVVASIAMVCAATCGGAEMNGPMSSGKPAEPSAPPPAASTVDAKEGGFDAAKLFANTCGWCHSDGGRAAGKGPKLMDTTLTDAEIVHRIEVGKTGAMPAFGGNFNEAELRAIVKYIRALRDDGPTR